MLMYSPTWLFVYPGIIVAALAFMATCVLLSSPTSYVGEGVRFPGVLLSCLLILAGIQSAVFGGFLLVFSIVEGFRPQKASFLRIFKYINLEVGLAVGTVLFLAGIVSTVSQLDGGVQMLPNASGMAGIIPAAMMALLGLQVVLSSFFFSVLGIGLRRTSHPFEELNNRQDARSEGAIERGVASCNESHRNLGNLD